MQGPYPRVWSILQSEIQFWSDRTHPRAEADHSGPRESNLKDRRNKWFTQSGDKSPSNGVDCFFKDHAIIFRLKLTTWYKGRGLTNVPQFWFQIWLGSLSYSVFDPVGASAAVTGVISNKKLQILPKGGKGGKGTHSQQSQLPPRGVWKTWWMQWMDLNWTEKCLGLFFFALCVFEPTYFRNKILQSTVILLFVCLYGVILCHF